MMDDEKRRDDDRFFEAAGKNPEFSVAAGDESGEVTRMLTDEPAAGTPAVEAEEMRNPIGEDEVRAAEVRRMTYVRDKAGFDEMLRDNQKWARMRQWEIMSPSQIVKEGEQDQPELKSVTAWLKRAIESRHADAMDGFPAANILAREEGDTNEAELLSGVIPAILEQNHFEDVYDEEQMRKIEDGTGCYGVFWDGAADGGIGEVKITNENLLNLAWDFAVEDLQDAEELFYYRERSVTSLVRQYPQLADVIQTDVETEHYEIDGFAPARIDRAVLVDWYYKVYDAASGREVLHMCRYCQGEVLFASENEVDEDGVAMYPRGWYEHGMYPFVLDPFYKMAGTCVGTGLVTVGKSMQEFIDRGNTAFLKAVLWGSEPRYIAKDGSLNEKELLDIGKHVVHYTGNSADAVKQMEPPRIPNEFLAVWNAQIDSLRETTGSNEVATGGTASGVTAASAIAAMQEAAGKTSRDMNRGSYRAFRKVVEMMIELIRQFYTIPHFVRIIGQNKGMEMMQLVQAGVLMPEMLRKENYISYTNERIAEYEDEDGVRRKPLFDVEITAERSSPYSRMAQNEMVLSLYNAGFFNPMNGVQSLAALEMMDFSGKEKVMRIVLQNYAMLAGVGAQAATTDGNGAAVNDNEMLGGEGKMESDAVTKARERAAETTQV